MHVHWIIFIALITIFITTEIYLSKNENHANSVYINVSISVICVLCGLLFAIPIYFLQNSSAHSVHEYLTAYTLELCLAIDNLFVFKIIFDCLKIGPMQQKKVLFWGICGAMLFRGIFLALGLEIFHRFQWMFLVCAIILILSGVKILLDIDSKKNPNGLLNWMIKKFNIQFSETTFFFVKIKNKRFITNTFAAIVAVELVDIIFAIDSVPAVLAVTQNQYIAYTSNIFAILTLRSMYFCLSLALDKISCLRYAAGALLIFIGIKTFLSHWIHISALTTLALSVSLIAMSIIFDFLKADQK